MAVMLMVSSALITTAFVHAPELMHERRARAAMDAPPQPVPDATQVELMRLVQAGSALPGFWSEPDESAKTPLLIDHSLALCTEARCDSAWLASMLLDPHQILGLPLGLRHALVAANAVSVRLPDAHLSGIQPEPAESLHWLFANPGTDPGQAWENLRLVRPDKAGVLRTTRAVVDADGEHALLLLRVDCGQGCPRAKAYLFVREAAGWELRSALWITAWGEGPNPFPPPPPR
jgi:hypothetical protein